MPELATKTDVLAIRSDLPAMEQRLLSELHACLEMQTLRLTIRLGVMWALAMWAVVIIVKLT
jgi:hypothetical protein